MVEPNDRANGDVPDDIIHDLRAVRRAHAVAFGFDAARRVEDLKKKDAASADRVVPLPPTPARHRPRAAGE